MQEHDKRRLFHPQYQAERSSGHDLQESNSLRSLILLPSVCLSCSKKNVCWGLNRKMGHFCMHFTFIRQVQLHVRRNQHTTYDGRLCAKRCPCGLLRSRNRTDYKRFNELKLEAWLSTLSPQLLVAAVPVASVRFGTGCLWSCVDAEWVARLRDSLTLAPAKRKSRLFLHIRAKQGNLGWWRGVEIAMLGGCVLQLLYETRP